MCSVKTPKAPTQERPATLVTQRDGSATGAGYARQANRNPLRIDLNDQTAAGQPAGSGLTIPNGSSGTASTADRLKGLGIPGMFLASQLNRNG